MKMFMFLKKLIGVGCLFAGFLHGQGTGANVVNVTTINNVSFPVGANVVNTPALQNIGQTSHLVKVIFSALTGSVGYKGVMQGSADCANYVNIGPTIIPSGGVTSSNNIFTLVGYGSFPCVRIGQTITVNSGATATVYENYSGTSTPVFITADQYGAINGLLSFVSGSSLVYGTKTILIGTATGVSLTFYGIEVSMPSTFTELQLFCSSDGGTTESPIIMDITNSVAGQVIWPLQLRPYGICPVNTPLYYLATGSGVGAINIQYRYE